MKVNQMNTNKDLSNNNLDDSQVMPGQQKSGAMPSSKASGPVPTPAPIKLTPLANAKARPKKGIKSIAELKAIASKMKPKKPVGSDYNG